MSRIATGDIGRLVLTLGTLAVLTPVVYANAPLRPHTPVEIVATTIATFWHVPVLLIVQLATLRAGGASRRPAQFALAGAMLVVGSGVIAGPPELSGIPWLLPRPSAIADAADALSMVCANLWLISLLITPVALWRRALTSDAPTRARAVAVAIAALVPLLTVALCAGLVLAGTIGGLDVMITHLALELGLPLAVVMTLFVLIAGVRPTASRRRSTMLALVTVAGLFSVLGAISVALIVGRGASPWAIAGVSATTLLTLLAATYPALRVVHRLLSPTAEPDRAISSPHTFVSRTSPGAEAARSAPQEALAVLSPRECEVLALLAEGRSNAGIARQLQNSPRTIEAHVRSIFAKLALEHDPSSNQRVRAARRWIEDTAHERSST